MNSKPTEDSDASNVAATLHYNKNSSHFAEEKFQNAPVWKQAAASLKRWKNSWNTTKEWKQTFLSKLFRSDFFEMDTFLQTVPAAAEELPLDNRLGKMPTPLAFPRRLQADHNTQPPTTVQTLSLPCHPHPKQQNYLGTASIQAPSKTQCSKDQNCRTLKQKGQQKSDKQHFVYT